MGDQLLLDIFVNGVPMPQGSKRALRNQHSGRVQLVESSKRVEPWRADIRAEVGRATAAVTFPKSGPMAVDLYFTLPRPSGHYRTGKNAGMLRELAPPYPAGRPDLDKLVRAVLDAIGSTGMVWDDDARVCHVNAWKYYATPDEPAGVQITVRSLA